MLAQKTTVRKNLTYIDICRQRFCTHTPLSHFPPLSESLAYESVAKFNKRITRIENSFHKSAVLFDGMKNLGHRSNSITLLVVFVWSKLPPSFAYVYVLFQCLILSVVFPTNIISRISNYKWEIFAICLIYVRLNFNQCWNFKYFTRESKTEH